MKKIREAKIAMLREKEKAEEAAKQYDKRRKILDKNTSPQ